MKNRKGATVIAAVAAVIIVCVILAAFVAPWVLSLVNTAPPSGTSNQFRVPTAAPYDSYIAERMEFFVGVEISSISADLIWGDRVGTCILYASLKDTGSVNFPSILNFRQTQYEETGAEVVTFTALTESGEYEFVLPGRYWLVLHAGCTELDQADNWRWYHPGLRSDYDTAVVEPMGPCVDIDLDGYWQDDECWSYDSSYTLGGRVYTTEGEPPPEEETDPTIVVSPGDEDFNWILYAVLGAVIVIVLVAALVVVRY